MQTASDLSSQNSRPTERGINMQKGGKFIRPKGSLVIIWSGRDGIGVEQKDRGAIGKSKEKQKKWAKNVLEGRERRIDVYKSTKYGFWSWLSLFWD